MSLQHIAIFMYLNGCFLDDAKIFNQTTTDNQPFDCTTLVWNSELFMIISIDAPIHYQGIPITPSIKFLH